MRVAIGTDEQGEVPDAVAAWCASEGHEVLWPTGPVAAWTEVGRIVGEAVAEGRADVGIVCCWTGTGVAIAATKVPGVRAALCTDAPTAVGARRWNDANVLALGLRLTTPELAREMCAAFLGTDVDAAERSVIAALEQTT